MDYSDKIARFEELFGAGREIVIISAPGRSEIGGNHTDHQKGCVLAAAVNLDVICVASANDKQKVIINSEGFGESSVDLNNLNPQENEHGSISALIRGVADWFVKNNYKTAGFDAYIASTVLSGSGLSSSAAFEVALGNIFNHLFNGGGVTPREIALAGQYAENVHFGKPSGLMDQMASSVGGFILIDFKDIENPVIEPIKFDLNTNGFALCITNTKGSHANLTDEYAAITIEMRMIAEYYNKQFLSEVNADDFYSDISKLRIKVNDRAVLRALHFFEENERVRKQAETLRSGNKSEFMKLVIQSGESSLACLQNIYAGGNPQVQGVSIALALSKKILEGTGGAWRVHGGGFAGTIQAFVPIPILFAYVKSMDDVFGTGSCQVLNIREEGGIRVL